MADWRRIGADIGSATGQTFQRVAARPVGGGSINQSFVLNADGQRYFVKLNRAELSDMFAAEAEALKALHQCGAIRVPAPIHHGVHADQAWLAIEYIALGSAAHDSAFEAGRRLATMHRQCQAERFGWHRDNTIGSTHQPNAWRDDWAAFWRDNRLGFQLEEAARNGYHGELQRKGEQLLLHLPALIDHAPRPSLLHGDLWGGNIGYSQDGEPVIFDPATYYGDAEADLAMTELFGGFGRSFYDGYQTILKIDLGYPLRKVLYNLYHILNHANLFGGGYPSQALHMMDRLLGELKAV